MPLQRRDDFVKTALGPAIAGALVYVCNQPASVAVGQNVTITPPSPLATIYGDPNGIGQLTQPITTDGYGHSFFYAAGGTYTIAVVWNNIVQQVYPDQSLGSIVSGIQFETNGTLNQTQTLLNLVAGANMTLTADSGGDVTFAVSSSGTQGQLALYGAGNSFGGDPHFDDGETTPNTLTYTATGGMALTGTGAGLKINSTGVMEWSTDTGISRDSAGAIDIGNGVQGNKSGTLNCTNANITGTITAGTVAATTLDGAIMNGTFNYSTASVTNLTTTGTTTIANSVFNSSGVMTKYNNINTALGGITPVYVSSTFTAQAANMTAQTLLAASALPADTMVSVSIVITITQAATASSTAPTPQLVFQERYSNTVQTVSLQPLLTTSATVNTVGSTYSYHAVISMKAANALQVQTTGYATSGATSMQYALVVNVQSFGG